MKLATITDMLREYCAASGKYAIMIIPSSASMMETHPDYVKEVRKAAPYLEGHDETIQFVADEVGYLLCDTREEMERLFGMTVGDDGPTKANTYDGPVRVYALTCGPDGLENENT